MKTKERNTMTRNLINDLLHIARTEIPLLEYNINNASTLYTLQESVRQLNAHFKYLLYHVLSEALAAQAQAPAGAPIAAAPPQAAVPIPVPATVLPPLQPPQAPAPGGGAKIMEVSITPSGTSVQAPGAPPIRLPPGTNVDASVIAPPAPVSIPGQETVVLPPGGVMPADVAAALGGGHAG